MKQVKYITLLTNSGEARVEKTTGEELNTISLITLLFDNCQFKNRADQRIADKIYQKIKEFPQGEDVPLEDAEFDVVFKYAQSFTPFLTGRAFEPFFAALEHVENP